ncbi:helix-turn-helix transcriptional regulator [Rhodanobacter sp. MP1X3]|uniref:helix-turn-helix transcriptional regulator n=1 Tax=Rhodanobacter sp. MP1X3 TaxID=2723086 RepID=UPI001614C2DA|nr:helix-turn-helix transcriptional regulator [Rhodanobacter sp. MP1X3]MBB6243309.1 transcriptional regulator with XRE-family HTH domain [Rhodanobacter sp. MP1X3]
MSTNRLSIPTAPSDNPLGHYLKDRRTKLDAARLGYPTTRRRTPGLRREEVAQRANVSITWYTWLEQGRGGAPSADVLDRLAVALALTDVEREHLFLLAQNRLPEVQHQQTEGITPQLQRILDTLEFSPAYVKTPDWDVIAWNRAAEVMMPDLLSLPEGKRNLLRLVFCLPHMQEKMFDWESVARFVVATFRNETAKSGISEYTKALIDELSQVSPAFKSMWLEHDVSTHGEGTKHIQHPTLGLITLEYSAFAVDGKPHLGLVIYNPVTTKDKAGVRALMESAT